MQGVIKGPAPGMVTQSLVNTEIKSVQIVEIAHRFFGGGGFVGSGARGAAG